MCGHTAACDCLCMLRTSPSAVYLFSNTGRFGILRQRCECSTMTFIIYRMRMSRMLINVKGTHRGLYKMRILFTNENVTHKGLVWLGALSRNGRIRMLLLVSKEPALGNMWFTVFDGERVTRHTFDKPTAPFALEYSSTLATTAPQSTPTWS
jgi:hypothetical protein